MDNQAPPTRATRNVVQRNAPVRVRVEARTTEFDCTGIASLYDAHEAKQRQPSPDLEAEIELGTDASEVDTKRGGGRLAHTMRRNGARGSQPAVELPLPAPAEEVPIEPSVTATMPVLMQSELAYAAAHQPGQASRTWWIVAGAAVVTSGLALVGVLLS